jgi:hypothetical protein
MMIMMGGDDDDNDQEEEKNEADGDHSAVDSTDEGYM